LIGPVIEGLSGLEDGYLPTIWTNGNGNPQTIPDGPIFKIFFEVIGDPTDCFEWIINSEFIDIEVVFETDMGEICVTDMINYNFTPTELCVECQELYLNYSSCADNIEFYVCGGTEPYTYSLEGPSGNVANGTFTSMDSISFSNLEAGLYLLQFSDAEDQTITPGTTIIEINSSDNDVTIEPTHTACNDNTIDFPNIVDLDQLISSSRPYTIIDPNGEILTSPVVDFFGQETGTYEYTYVVEGPYPCEDEIYTLIINVLDCACPPIGLTPIGERCNNVAFPLNLNQFLIPGTEPGTFSLLDENGELYFIQPASDGVLFTDNLEAGIYTIEFILTFPEVACPESVQETITILDGPQLSFNGVAVNVCNSDTLGNVSILDLNTLVTSGTGIWTDEQGNIVENGIIDFDGTTAGFVTFTFTTDTAVFPCENLSLNIGFDVIDCIPTSVNITSSESISIYPNPNFGVVNIKIESKAEAIIYDLNGKICREFSLSSDQNEVNLEELESGLYFLVISREGRIIRKHKLIIE